MTGPGFDRLCQLVQERSGLMLGPEKAYLLKARLDPVARSEGYAGVEDLLQRARLGLPDALLERCVEALATHESSFFRDSSPFEILKSSVLPQLAAQRAPGRTLRVWCGACSSGQEPYSVAMIVQELAAALAGHTVEILATDFSASILSKAESGVYSDFEVKRGLSPERLETWFTREPEGWRVSPKLRAMVTFKQHNLLHELGGLGPFDIVFCRNVLIYFDAERKQQVLTKLASAMTSDGWLFLGSAEPLIGLPAGLAPAAGAHGLCRRTPAIAA